MELGSRIGFVRERGHHSLLLGHPYWLISAKTTARVQFTYNCQLFVGECTTCSTRTSKITLSGAADSAPGHAKVNTDALPSVIVWQWASSWDLESLNTLNKLTSRIRFEEQSCTNLNSWSFQFFSIWLLASSPWNYLDSWKVALLLLQSCLQASSFKTSEKSLPQ